MAEPRLRDDPTLDEALEGGLSGQLVPFNGYRRAVFTPTTLEALESTYAKLIQLTLDDYEKIEERRQKNLDAHEGIGRRGETITIPIAKRDTNQQLAWLLTTLFRDPLVTVKPLEAGHVQIITQDANGAPELSFVSTSEEARDLQDLVNFYLENKIAFKRTCRTWIAELLRDGNRPPLLKIVHDPRETFARGLQVVEGGSYEGEDGQKRTRIKQIIDDPVIQRVRDGEATRIECVPPDRFYLPLPEYDIQRSTFCFQEFEEDSVTLRRKIADGTYNFCLPDGEKPDSETIDLVLSGLSDLETLRRDRQDGRKPIDPQKMHRMFEKWFYFPFAEDAGGGETVFRIVSFCSVFHWPSKKYLTCYENPYWFSARPFHPGFMQQRPFSFSGYSTTENVGPFQRLISQLFHLQVQNMVQANVKVFLVRRTSSTAKFLNGRRLRPGMVIPFDEPTDVSPQQLGTNIQSMSAEIAFLNSESEKMSVVTQYDRGNIPNRTPAATVAAVENLAKMQPAMVLDNIRDTIGAAVKMFVQALIQFSPQGITIPYEDPKKRAVIARLVHFPRQMITDQFAFNVTATADDETPQALFVKDMQLTQQLSAFNQEAQMIAAAAWKPGVPPPLVQLGTTMVLGKRRMTAELLRNAKLDPDEFLPKESDIEGIPAQLLQIKQTMQQVGGQGETNVPGSVPGATAGGSVSAAGGIPSGHQLMAGPPNDAGGHGGVPA